MPSEEYSCIFTCPIAENVIVNIDITYRNIVPCVYELHVPVMEVVVMNKDILCIIIFYFWSAFFGNEDHPAGSSMEFALVNSFQPIYVYQVFRSPEKPRCVFT